MEKNISVGAEARKEISKEKARIFRTKTEAPSLLERIAAAWKKKKAAAEREKQKEISSTEEKSFTKGESVSKGENLSLSFRESIINEVVDYDKQKLAKETQAVSEGLSWVQYKPWQKEEEKEKKEVSVNTATIVSLRKKLMAAEWARALGKRAPDDNRFCNLEQEAATWYQKRDEEKSRKEEIRLRIEKHKEVLSKALEEFGRQLSQNKDMAEPKELVTLLEKSLENAGEIFDIEWQEGQCLVWIELWEEKKRRKILSIDIPFIYRVKIDENFEISSFEVVEDEEIIESLKEELLTKPLKESLEEVSFNIDKEEEAKGFLEDKLSEIGQIISLERTETGWLATLESWEELRLRNIKRKGKPPIVSDEIEVDWKDGRLEFVTEENINQEEGGEENE